MPGHPESFADPAVRIRSKIKERRVLEARFLFRQFSGEIGAREGRALELELARLLAEVERMRHLAREAAAEGRREEAARLYRNIEQVAVDVPGLAEEQRALAGAEAILSRIAARSALADSPAPTNAAALEPTPHPETGENKTVQPPVDPDSDAALSTMEILRRRLYAWRQRFRAWGQSGLAGVADRCSRRARLARVQAPLWRSRFQRLPRRMWLAAGCVGLALLLLVIWRVGTNEPAPSPSSIIEPAQDTLASPAVSGSPVPTDRPASVHPSLEAAGQPTAQPPEPGSVPVAPAATVEPAAQQSEPPAVQAAPRSTRLKLGDLHVEESGKQ